MSDIILCWKDGVPVMVTLILTGVVIFLA